MKAIIELFFSFLRAAYWARALALYEVELWDGSHPNW